jgi:hypothetical protein
MDITSRLRINFLLLPFFGARSTKIAIKRDEWDTILNELLNRYEFTNIKEHTAQLGNITVWTSNHPYSSFSNYNEDFHKNTIEAILPYYKTREIAFKKLRERKIKNVLEEAKKTTEE